MRQRGGRTEGGEEGRRESDVGNRGEGEGS